MFVNIYSYEDNPEEKDESKGNKSEVKKEK